MPTILPPCWPGSCTREVLAQCASVPLLKKVSVGTTGTLSHCSTFHTLQPSGKSIVYLSHGKSWPTSCPSSRHHHDPPTLWHCLGLWPPPQLGCATRCVCFCLLNHTPSSNFTCSSLSWHRSRISLPWEGREPLGCFHWHDLHCPRSNLVSSITPEDFPHPLIKLPYYSFWSIFYFGFQTSY